MGICISKLKISNSNLNKVFNIESIHKKKHLCETPSTKYKSQSKSNSINPIQTHFTSFRVTQQAREKQNEAELKMEEQKKKKKPS